MIVIGFFLDRLFFSMASPSREISSLTSEMPDRRSSPFRTDRRASIEECAFTLQRDLRESRRPIEGTPNLNRSARFLGRRSAIGGNALDGRNNLSLTRRITRRENDEVFILVVMLAASYEKLGSGLALLLRQRRSFLERS